MLDGLEYLVFLGGRTILHALNWQGCVRGAIIKVARRLHLKELAQLLFRSTLFGAALPDSSDTDCRNKQVTHQGAKGSAVWAGELSFSRGRGESVRIIVQREARSQVT